MPGTLGERAVIDQAEAARKGAKADILRDREGARQREFLLNDGDAGAAGFGRRQAAMRLAIDIDRPSIGRKRSRQEVDQGRLARSILTQEGVDATRLKRD